MASIDFRTPGAGFDQPLDLWQACHERVLRMCTLLQRLQEHLATRGVDGDAKITAVSVLRYFDEAAPRHHEDEELDLFPGLLAHLKPGLERDEGLRRALELLRQDHRDMDGLWRILRVPLAEIAAGRQAVLDDAVIGLFVSRYRSHCEVEDTVLAPALRRLLTEREITALTRSMAARRGVDWDEIRADTGSRTPA